MPTIRFLACLIVLPVVTSLAVGARRAPAPKALAGRPTNGKAAVCQRLGLEQEELAAAPFKTNGRRHVFNHEQWYECSEPATDPMMTCILAPEWMKLEEGTWLCSDALKSDEKTVRNSYAEDSY